MIASSLQHMPPELCERILAMLRTGELRTVRLVCRYLAVVASAIIHRSVWFPVMTEARGIALYLRKPEDRNNLENREEATRMHAISLLANPATAAVVSRFSLTGLDSQSCDIIESTRHNLVQPRDIDTALQVGASRARVEFVAAMLEKAGGLKELRIAVDFQNALRLLKSSICCNVRSLTLEYMPDDLKNEEMVPLMPSLSRLKLVAIWPSVGSFQPTVPRIDFSRFPGLTWLKLCGSAPARFLKIFTGKTISIQRCVIMGSLDFFTEGIDFFSRFCGGLNALVISGGSFLAPITCNFPNLRSLKVIGGFNLRGLEAIGCPNLEQLSLSEDSLGSLVGSSFITKLVNQCSSKLTKLYLDSTKNILPFTFLKSAVDALSWCEELRTFGINGPVQFTQGSLRVFGRTHTKLKAFMVSYDCFCPIPDTLLDEMKNNFFTQPIPGLQIMNPASEHDQLRPKCYLQVSDPDYWRAKSCDCGWMQKGYFVRSMDPDELFEDDDSDGDIRDFERLVDNSCPCQCANVTVSSRPRSPGRGQELIVGFGQTLETPRKGKAQISLQQPRAPRKGEKRGRSVHLPTPVEIEDSDDENDLVVLDKASGISQHDDSDYAPRTRPSKRTKK